MLRHFLSVIVIVGSVGYFADSTAAQYTPAQIQAITVGVDLGLLEIVPDPTTLLGFVIQCDEDRIAVVSSQVSDMIIEKDLERTVLLDEFVSPETTPDRQKEIDAQVAGLAACLVTLQKMAYQLNIIHQFC